MPKSLAIGARFSPLLLAAGFWSCSQSDDSVSFGGGSGGQAGSAAGALSAAGSSSGGKPASGGTSSAQPSAGFTGLAGSANSGNEAGQSSAGGSAPVAGSDALGGGGGAGPMAGASDYDAAVLADSPVAYWGMTAAGASEPDLTGNENTGSYVGGAPAAGSLPNGDHAADFDGESQYLTVPSAPSLSIPTTGELSWEAWIRPDVVQFPNATNSGYVDWLGKCAEYAPSCEWEGRMYSATNSEDRCNRLSAYVFNPGADLGSGAYWQGECGLIEAGSWYHVVGEYTMLDQPPGCEASDSYPGSINIWVNGVKWNQTGHGQTGCFGQYEIAPEAGDSPLNIGTVAGDSWFLGAIGKVAIYDYLLSQEQISEHYALMTGQPPSGSCDDSCTF